MVWKRQKLHIIMDVIESNGRKLHIILEIIESYRWENAEITHYIRNN